jgi:hypothetical protein
MKSTIRFWQDLCKRRLESPCTFLVLGVLLGHLLWDDFVDVLHYVLKHVL